MREREKIAVIGAGLAGLTAARALSEKADVVIFEKSRGFGGRMSTRRAEPFFFDHGAKVFEARGANFRAFLKPFIAQGIVQPWAPDCVVLEANGKATASTPDHPQYVASPAMNSLCKEVAMGLDVKLATRVASVMQSSNGWTVRTVEEDQFMGFDWVVFTAPAEQTQVLMPESFAASATLLNARMLGCYTLMLGYENSLPVPWDMATVRGSPIATLTCNHAKPGRQGATSIVVQSTNHWAQEHLEDDQDDVKATLAAAFSELTGISAKPTYTSLHRWRYAAVATAAGQPYLIDPDQKLAAAGDWCLDAHVESAFDSGSALAADIAARL